MGVLAGVQLDGRGAEVARTLDRIPVRADEEARPNARVVQPRDAVTATCWIMRGVEATLGRGRGAALRDERHLVRPETPGDGEHLVRAGHLEVQYRRDLGCESLDVAVLNVPSVFPQVRGDAVGTGALAEQRGSDGVGLVPTPGLAN